MHNLIPRDLLWLNRKDGEVRHAWRYEYIITYPVHITEVDEHITNTKRGVNKRTLLVCTYCKDVLQKGIWKRVVRISVRVMKNGSFEGFFECVVSVATPEMCFPRSNSFV